MPMYGSSAAGLPSGLATVNVRDASRFTTSAESPRCHVIVDPSLSTAESVFPLPASLFPVSIQASSGSDGRHAPASSATSTLVSSVWANPLSCTMSA